MRISIILIGCLFVLTMSACVSYDEKKTTKEPLASHVSSIENRKEPDRATDVDLKKWPDHRLSDFVCVVTGGANGLGAATAEELLSLGAKVIVFDLVKPTDEKLLRYENKSLFFKKVNITDEIEVKSAFADSVKLFGKLNVLINCAGVGYVEETVSEHKTHDTTQFMRVMTINLMGTFLCCKHAAWHMKLLPVGADGERGVIINVASIAAMEGTRGQVAYAASKGAIVGMSMPMARDLSQYRIRVATIAPGPIDTGIKMADYATKLKAMSVVGRFGRPDEFARLAVHIIENRYIAGSVIRMDGGLVKPHLF